MASIERHDRAVAAARVRRGAMLAAGDALAFMAFAALGRASHSEAAGIAAILQVAETAAPFAIGWFVVAPFAGAYRAELVQQPRLMLARSALAWLLAWPLGLLLRALIRQSTIPLSFAIVTLITNMLILLGWRGVFAWLASRHT
ncbi:MAG: DUF3054 domain-containing protein [Roseiflexaceae bacterium]